MEDRDHRRTGTSDRYAGLYDLSARHIAWRYIMLQINIYAVDHLCGVLKSLLLLCSLRVLIAEGLNAIIVFQACYLPDTAVQIIHYLMENSSVRNLMIWLSKPRLYNLLVLWFLIWFLVTTFTLSSHLFPPGMWWSVPGDAGGGGLPDHIYERRTPRTRCPALAGSRSAIRWSTEGME